MKCKKVKNIWRIAQLERVRLKVVQCPDPLSIFEVVFQLDEQECIKVCILFRIKWHQRNKANAGDEMRAPNLSSMNYHVVEFRNIKHRRMPRSKQLIRDGLLPNASF